MGRHKFRQKKLNEIIEGDNWYRVNERPIPSPDDVAVAVAAHNANYLEGAASNGTAQSQQRPLLSPSYVNSSVKVTYNPTPKPQLDWTCPVADVKGCPIAVEPQVEMPVELYRACTELAGEFDTEWIAFLIGQMNQQTGRAMITEMYFPPQSASGAHVEAIDESFRPRTGTIAAIHSHVRMDAFWSKTDEDHANWPIEIVINARGESKCRFRIKLDCGRFSRVDGKVMLTGAKAADVFRESLKAALKPTTSNPAGYGDSHDSQGKLVAEGSPWEGYEECFPHHYRGVS